MKKAIIKALSVVLVVVLILTSAPLSGFVGLEVPQWLDFSINASAAETSGTCGKNLTWTFDESTGTLTISGTGGMINFSSNNRPWEIFEDDVKKVIINNGIITIGDYAFFSCGNLTNVTIPNSVTFIGNSSFTSCNSLVSITIPNSITAIGDGAFCNCNSLESITIPDSVTTIGDDAFEYCDSLTSVNVDSNNQYYSNDEYGVLFNKDKTTLIKYPIGNTRISYTIPDGVTTIGASAFSCCENLTSIIIPDSVTSMGDCAFSECYNLISIEIPNSITCVNLYTFFNCWNLTSVTLPNSVTAIGNGAFYSCNSLTSITIPDSVTTIGESAFEGCYSLTSVTIPDSVTAIDDDTFSYCGSLTSVTIPDSIALIDYGAFRGCNKIKDVYYSGTEEQWNKISIGSYNECLTNATIHYNSTGSNFDNKICSLCGGNYDVATVAPTCDADGLTIYTCVSCGNTYTEVINALGHDMQETTAAVDPTCEAAGSTAVYTCANGCGNTEGGEEVAATGHNIVNGVCSVCGATETTDDDQKQYINEHINFVNSNQYNNLITNASFYNSIWKYEEDSRNFTAYAAWDVIGDIGDVVTLNFWEIANDNPYDIILSELFSSYIEKDSSSAVTTSNEIFKEIASVDKMYSNIISLLKTADNWQDSMELEIGDILKEFLKYGKDKWVEGVWFTESNFDIQEYSPELYDILSSALPKVKNWDSVFGKLNNVSTVTNYITTGSDIVFAFFDAYQKYLLVETVVTQYQDILGSISAASYSMPTKARGLLNDALDTYSSALDYNSVIEYVFEDIAKSAYDLTLKTCLQKVSYNLVAKALGCSVAYVSAAAVTYSLTYWILDNVSGVGKESEMHYLMNAAALLEESFIEQTISLSSKLKNSATLENAIMFDSSWSFLQEIEVYSYTCLSKYISACKQNYGFQYSLSVATNPWNLLFGYKNYSDKISNADSGIEAAVYLSSEWKKAVCHNGTYSATKLATVKCPTDVYIYSDNGELLLSIVDNKIITCDSSITAMVDGNEKIIALNANQEYEIKITATDDGTMNYAITEFCDNEIIRTVLYENVELTNNSSYYGNVPTEIRVAAENYDLISEDGQTVSANEDYIYEELVYSFFIQSPSRTEIRNKDGIILHANVEGTAPAGSYVKWESSNGNFDEDADGNDLTVIAKNKGYTTFTAILCAEDGTELARDSVELYSKSGFFDKIGGFFRSLFGSTKIYEN